jgi:hypothetical protein
LIKLLLQIKELPRIWKNDKIDFVKIYT